MPDPFRRMLPKGHNELSDKKLRKKPLASQEREHYNASPPAGREPGIKGREAST